jgi:hypothetical protein
MNALVAQHTSLQSCMVRIMFFKNAQVWKARIAAATENETEHVQMYCYEVSKILLLADFDKRLLLVFSLSFV